MKTIYLLKIIKQKRVSFVIALLSISILIDGCRKDISVPNQDFKKLFGTWRWVQSSGGYSGNAITPASEGYSLKIEFDKNGVTKKYKNGKRISKQTYKFIEQKSIYSNTSPSYLIQYQDLGMHKRYAVPQSFNFVGQDSLYLADECFDCYGSVYVREK